MQSEVLLKYKFLHRSEMNQLQFERHRTFIIRLLRIEQQRAPINLNITRITQLTALLQLL
jgi:hypothetical protein